MVLRLPHQIFQASRRGECSFSPNRFWTISRMVDCR